MNGSDERTTPVIGGGAQGRAEKSASPRPPSDRLRWRMLRRLEGHLELPMALLAAVWLVIFILEAVRGTDPLLTFLGIVVWIVFVAEFVIRLLVAPDRWRFVRNSWLTLISLVVPALRIARLGVVFRAARAARAARGLRLIRAIGALNRSMGALGRTLRRSGVWYVFALTVAVCFAGAAGMYALEPHSANGAGFASYADALWWTAMIMTTMGSAYWPHTAEARILAVLISLVAIGVFGYVTATIASFLVGREAEASDGGPAGGSDLRALRRDIASLRREVRVLSSQLTRGS